MTIRTRLTERLGLRHPILLAPMGFAAGGKLAGAVTDAGGLGLIGGGYGDAAWLEREFAVAGNRRVGCGFITWSMAKDPALLDRALAHAPAAMLLSFGDPRPFAARIRAAKTLLMCQVQTADQALAALDAGAEIVVAQGYEAGGHGGGRGTLALVPALADLVARRAPQAMVVAAGGIADGRGLAASLALGAEGVMMGTRFVASAESLTHPRMKARVVAATGEDTVRTSVFDAVRGYAWPDGITGRALKNDFTARWHGRETALNVALAGEQARYRAAAEAGDPETAVMFASESAGLVTDAPPAADIVTRIVAEAETAIAASSRRVV